VPPDPLKLQLLPLILPAPTVQPPIKPPVALILLVSIVYILPGVPLFIHVPLLLLYNPLGVNNQPAISPDFANISPLFLSYHLVSSSITQVKFPLEFITTFPPYSYVALIFHPPILPPDA